LLAFGVLLGFTAAAILLALWVQSRGTFPRPPAAAQNPRELAAAHGEAIWLYIAGARVEAWLLPAASGRPAPLLIYAHGNGELIDFWADRVSPLRAAGVAVLLVEFPGYGRSQGAPSEESITATLVAAYDRAARDPRVDSTRIVGYGRSLGGGAIAQLAARRPLAVLVLESSFTSLADMIRGYGLPNWLVLNRFDTRAVLTTFPKPVLLIHGVQDGIIPVAHARTNFAAAPHATLELLECGHNDCPPQWELVLGFLAQNGVCKKPDQEDSHEYHC